MPDRALPDLQCAGAEHDGPRHTHDGGGADGREHVVLRELLGVDDLDDLAVMVNGILVFLIPFLGIGFLLQCGR